MGVAQPGKWVVPNLSDSRHVRPDEHHLWRSLLLIAVGHAAWYLYTPTFTKRMQERVEQLKQQQATEKAEREKKLADIKKREALAKTEEEKVALQDEQVLLEKNVTVPVVPFGDLASMNVFADKRLVAYYSGEVAAAIVLNVLMIVSGAGLLGLKEWGRRIGIVVAQLKIVRWLAMTVLMMVLVLPVNFELSRKAAEATEAQMKAQGAGMPFAMSDLLLFGMIFTAVWQIFCAIVACVYPALFWWYLTRPPARAACMKQARTRTAGARSSVGNDSLNVARLVFGHLAGIECRACAARGWLLWLRSLVGLAARGRAPFHDVGVVAHCRYDPTFMPGAGAADLPVRRCRSFS